MPFKFSHIHLKSVDPRKSAAWYVECLGAKVQGESEVRGATFVRLDLEGVPINVSAPDPGEEFPPGSAEKHLGLEHFAFTVEDLEGLLERVQQHGGIVKERWDPPSGARIAWIEAPDDVRIELIQPPT